MSEARVWLVRMLEDFVAGRDQSVPFAQQICSYGGDPCAGHSPTARRAAS
jgi:hypothetical protein